MNNDRWLDLMNSLGFDENAETYQALYDAYTEPHRRYHTIEHISAMLKHLELAVDRVRQPSLVELALWFHDAIYAPFSSNNEADSAAWAVQFLKDNHASDKNIDVVFDLILATEHTSQASTHDQALLVDIDLSILGTPEDVFKQFEKDIRFEYKRVPYFLYKKKRKAVLQSFLDRDAIYQTTFFLDKFETRARHNIELALQQL